MALVRQLSRPLHAAMLAEAHLVQVSSSSAAAWAQYLESAGAADFTYYGEDLQNKFPRHVAGTKALNQSKGVGRGKVGAERNGEMGGK